MKDKAAVRAAQAVQQEWINLLERNPHHRMGWADMADMIASEYAGLIAAAITVAYDRQDVSFDDRRLLREALIKVGT